jgi:hypothetical protein
VQGFKGRLCGLLAYAQHVDPLFAQSLQEEAQKIDWGACKCLNADNGPRVVSLSPCVEFLPELVGSRKGFAAPGTTSSPHY